MSPTRSNSRSARGTEQGCDTLMTQLRNRTASRLHFGLLGWGPQAPRQFGGVGLMIEAPGIEPRAEPAPNWSFAGPLANRVQDTLRQIQERRSQPPVDRPEVAPARIQVVTAPPDHVGLGVGTQLSLAVVRLILKLAGDSDP